MSDDARAVGRELARQQAPAAPVPDVRYQVPDSSEERPDIFAAIDQIFAAQEARIDELEKRIAALEARPAARSIEHVRDSAGNVIRSVVLETPLAEPN